MAKRRLEVVITGDEDSASKALRNTDQELGKTEKALDNVGKSARNMSDDVDKGTSSIASKIKGLGSKLVTGGTMAGLAVGAALAKGITDGMDAESVNAKLSAQLGNSPENAKKFGKLAGKIYGEAYGDSLSTVSDALRFGQLNQLTDGTEAGIERITKKTLDLSTAFDQDLNQATAAAGTLIKTGLVKNADEAFDVLTAGFQRGVDKQGDFLDTLIEYPTLFRDLGLSAKDATGILSQGLDAGARDADKVADALKEFSIRAVDGSDLTADGFKRLGVSGEDMARRIAKGGPDAAKALDTVLDKLRGMKDPVERSRIAVELFGTQAEDLGDALFALDPSEAVANLDKVEGAAKRMGDTLNDTSAVRMETFKRQALQKLQAFSVGAFTTVSGLVDQVRPTVTAFWKTLTTGLTEDEGTGIERVALRIRGVIFGIRDAFNSFLAGMRGEGGPGSFFTDLGEGIAAFGRVAMPIVTSVVTFLRDHFKPILLGLAALTAPLVLLAGGFIYLYQTSETFRNVVTGVFAVVKAVVTTVIDVIVGYFRFVLIPVIQEVVEAVQAAWRFIEPPLEAMRSFIADKLAPVWTAMLAGAKLAWEALPGIVNGALRLVGGILSSFLNSSASIADAIGLDHIADSLRTGAAATKSWGQGAGTNNTGAGTGNIAVQGGIRRRHGGFIPGPDVKRDIINAKLSPREYVMSPEATDKWGVPMLDAMNFGFRRGGLVPGIDDITGLARSGVSKLRSIGAAGLDAAWPRMATDSGFASFPAGGANYLRDAALDFIKGKDKERQQAAASGTGMGGSVADWVRQAMQITGVPESWFGPLMSRVKLESGGNPAAINLWDSNAKKGIPSKGLFQTIDPTFNRYALPGLGNIWNPVANGVAAIRYMLARYGSIFNINPRTGYRFGGLAGAGVSVHGRSFDAGGVLEPGWNLLANRTGGREPLTPRGGSDADIVRRLDQMIALLASRGAGINIEQVDVHDGTDVDRLAARLVFQVGAHTP